MARDHSPESGACELRTDAVVRNAESRNPAESQGDLVSTIESSRAVRIFARVFDDAMGDTGRANTTVAHVCGLSEKSIRNARIGAQSLPAHALFQVDSELRGAIIRGIERECERIYSQRAPADVRTALLTLSERVLHLGLAATSALKRLSTGRPLSPDHCEALTTQWAATVRAGDEMVTALNASRGER